MDGLLAALSPSATEPAAVSEQDDKNSRINVLKAMQPPARKAYLAYQIAELKAGSRLEDRKAYDLLKEEGLGDNAGDLGELNDYPLPAFESWSRKLRDARRLLGEQKHSPRAGRASGSVVSRDQI